MPQDLIFMNVQSLKSDPEETYNTRSHAYHREREIEIEFTSLRTRRKVAWADNLHTTPYAQLTEGPGKQSLRSIYGCIR